MQGQRTGVQRVARSSVPLLICLLIGVLLRGGSGAVRACGIDGVPSMSLNGRLVRANHAQATKDTIAYWAPFLLGTAPAHADLRLSENEKELHRSLTAQAFATPFRWTFGDGTSARGLAVHHRYSQPGWYRVDVSYYYTPRRQWIAFDSAQLQIPATRAPGGATPAPTPPGWLLGGAALGIGALLLTLAVALRRPRPLPAGREARPQDRRGPPRPARRRGR